MRVISGKYRGRRLNSPLNDEIRPTSDKVKESIFNVIQFEIANSRFLDLFAGSGSIGIEALSRGAKEVLFADVAKASLQLLKSNLNGINDNYKVVARDYKDALYSAQGKWNFIFVDPPYKCDYINEICKIVIDRDMLARDGYIVYEHAQREYELPEDMCILKRKVFGIVYVDYIGYSRGKVAITGSFDPITKGHLDILEKALDDYDKATILIAQNPDKEYLFTLEERAAFARLATEEYLNVNVDICDGFVYEYCKNKNIDTVYRGYRNDDDVEYEKQMARFNEERGVKTVLIEGKSSVSSTLVREMLSKGEDIKKYLPNKCVRAVIKAYKEKL
ncbi:MAG: 16S rRNA (guanine(966)-N(2))-methyltransferase RsmD [Clostridia bacterium]|nr:16S rRNA (guanine(966)-N(2))-methyltransferase RsmD [Clostridia bacterium]MDE7329306.1 16S rRNA (guanine(966)-N(2))-methyltransferase RsmD [Clostridia bacterium]